MKRYVQRILFWTAVSILIDGAIIAGLIAFGTATRPAVATAITKPFADIDTQALPALLRYKARDGIPLSYREYPVSGSKEAALN